MHNADRATRRATELLNTWLQETRGLPVTVQLDKLGVRIAEALTAAYDSAGITFVCEFCAQLVRAPNVNEIDSGTILICPKCAGETVVDLSRPDERKAWYKLGLWTSRRPRRELKALSDVNSVFCPGCAKVGHARPECRGCTRLIEEARLTVARWLNELE